MKVIASAAISLDGCLDDRSRERLVLSSPEDWEAVYALRASCDAILAGAGTLRADDPSLLAKGRGRDPLRVTVSRSGKLDPSLRFFTGPGRPVVFTAPGCGEALRGVADVVESMEITPGYIVAQLARRGVELLMVEGGAHVLEQFLSSGIVDELRLAIAPVAVGDPLAPHFTGNGAMILQEVEVLGGVSVHHFLSPDRHYLKMAIDQSRLCVPSATAYSVGAVVVARSGAVFCGHTHETSPSNHAEEEAIAKALAAGENLNGAVMYSSMEPCSKRASKPVSCSEHIIRNGFSRVVYALREPAHFVDGQGCEMLTGAGVGVREIADMAQQVIEINKHICI